MIQISRRAGLCGLFAFGIADMGVPTARAAGLGRAELWKTMKLVRSNGRTFTLNELPGSVVVAYIWGSYCPACVDQLPLLRRLPQAVGNRSLEVVLIGPSDEWASDYAMASRYGMGGQVATIDRLEPSARVAAAFGMEEDGTLDVPQSFVFARPDLRLVHSELGTTSWSNPGMVALLRRAAFA